MTNAGPGDNIDNNETVEDAAGRFLAAGLSLGVMWWADTPDEFLDELTDTGAVRNSDVLLVAAHSDTEERAGRYLSPDREKWPEWLKAATPGAQKTVMHWSRNHKLATKRGLGIGEFKAWDHNETFGAAPQRQGSYRAALALHDANLSGPLLPLLRLVTLEDVGQWPTVLRYLTAKRSPIRALCYGHAEGAVSVRARCGRRCRGRRSCEHLPRRSARSPRGSGALA